MIVDISLCTSIEAVIQICLDQRKKTRNRQTYDVYNLLSGHKRPKLLSPTKWRQKVVDDGGYMPRFLFRSSWIQDYTMFKSRTPKVTARIFPLS